mmetsp:Transcript_27682/g.55941  ORF Transcript_27682/g.55941 Transcript_27682/m.55941 type:complete len:183 (+) Transcript_27682:883-1431(+)
MSLTTMTMASEQQKVMVRVGPTFWIPPHLSSISPLVLRVHLFVNSRYMGGRMQGEGLDVCSEVLGILAGPGFIRLSLLETDREAAASHFCDSFVGTAVPTPHFSPPEPLLQNKNDSNTARQHIEMVCFSLPVSKLYGGGKGARASSASRGIGTGLPAPPLRPPPADDEGVPDRTTRQLCRLG